MLPLPKPATGLIGDFRLRVLDGEEDRGGHTAVAILAEALRQQGYQADAAGPELEARGPKGARIPGREPWTDLLMVLDEGLLTREDLLASLNPEGILVVATDRRASEVRRRLRRYTGTVATVDAENLATTFGSDPAIAALGAAARVVGFVDPEVLGTCTWMAYDRQWPYAAISAVRTLDAGWEQVDY